MRILSQEGSQRKFLLEEDDEEKEKYKSNSTEDIYHDELFFGDDTFACKNK